MDMFVLVDQSSYITRDSSNDVVHAAVYRAVKRVSIVAAHDAMGAVSATMYDMVSKALGLEMESGAEIMIRRAVNEETFDRAWPTLMMTAEHPLDSVDGEINEEHARPSKFQ